MLGLQVEYAESGKEYRILVILSLFCEYAHLECVRIHVIYRVKQAEYGIKNTGFYLYLACFVNTFALSMYVSMSYTGLTRRNTVLRIQDSIHT